MSRRFDSDNAGGSSTILAKFGTPRNLSSSGGKKKKGKKGKKGKSNNTASVQEVMDKVKAEAIEAKEIEVEAAANSSKFVVFSE